MPNLFYTYKQFYFKVFSLVNKVKQFQILLCITNNSIKHQLFIQTHLNISNNPFQHKHIGSYQVLPLRDRVDRGVMAMKFYSTNPKAPALLKTHHPIFFVSYPGYSLGESYSSLMQSVYSAFPAHWATGHSLGESYPSAEMQSVYSTAPADWAR